MQKRAGSSKRAKHLQMETGATGLEPATSGVTGDARANTILHGTARKNPISRCSIYLPMVASTGAHDVPGESRPIHAPLPQCLLRQRAQLRNDKSPLATFVFHFRAQWSQQKWLLSVLWRSAKTRSRIRIDHGRFVRSPSIARRSPSRKHRVSSARLFMRLDSAFMLASTAACPFEPESSTVR